MVAKRPIGRRKSAAIILLAVVMLSLSTGFAAVASADLPNLHNNGDGTRTITWRMNTTDGLTLQGVELANGHVTLPWRQHNLTWAGPAQFAANVLSNDNLSYETDGITLRADTNNYVADGDFSTAAPWSFVPSPGGNEPQAGRTRWLSSGTTRLRPRVSGTALTPRPDGSVHRVA